MKGGPCRRTRRKPRPNPGCKREWRSKRLHVARILGEKTIGLGGREEVDPDAEGCSLSVVERGPWNRI